MLQEGFQIEHCRPNCPKSARNWNNLYNVLNHKLNELNLFEKLERKFKPVLHHHLPKVSLAGCPNGCSHPDIKDFGVTGYSTPSITEVPCSGCKSCMNSCLEKAITVDSSGVFIDNTLCLSCGNCQKVCPTGTISAGESGWTLRFGGRVGRHPQFAKYAGQVTTDEEVVSWIIGTMLNYLEEGGPQERLTHFLER